MLARKLFFLQFMRQVRSEILKVVWPTRKEVWASVLMVFIMVAFLSLFFFVVDQIFSVAIRVFLDLGMN